MLKNIVYWRKQMALHRMGDRAKYYHYMFMAAFETKTWRETNTLTAVKR